MFRLTVAIFMLRPRMIASLKRDRDRFVFSLLVDLQEALKKAKAGVVPPAEELYTNIWVAGEKYDRNVVPKYVRLPDRAKSVGDIMVDAVV